MPELLLPIKGEHIREALAQGRVDQEKLRRDELQWLDNYNPLFGIRLKAIFETAIKAHGITSGEALFAGSLLGHRSVRFCVASSIIEHGADTGLYHVGMDNFVRNSRSKPLEQGLTRPVQLSAEGPLTTTFEDPDLVAAMLEISHPVARDSAATIVSFFCYDEVPELT